MCLLVPSTYLQLDPACMSGAYRGEYPKVHPDDYSHRETAKCPLSSSQPHLAYQLNWTAYQHSRWKPNLSCCRKHAYFATPPDRSQWQVPVCSVCSHVARHTMRRTLVACGRHTRDVLRGRRKARIAVGMSGGVDSTVAALRLQRFFNAKHSSLALTLSPCHIHIHTGYLLFLPFWLEWLLLHLVHWCHYPPTSLPLVLATAYTPRWIWRSVPIYSH